MYYNIILLIVYCQFVSDIAIFVLKRDIKLQLTNLTVYCQFLNLYTTQLRYLYKT